MTEKGIFGAVEATIADTRSVNAAFGSHLKGKIQYLMMREVEDSLNDNRPLNQGEIFKRHIETHPVPRLTSPKVEPK